jgi:glutamine synthetase
MMYVRSWPAPRLTAGVGRPGFVRDLGLWSPQQQAAAEEIEACLGSVDLVRLVFCDPHGLPRSKTLSVEAFREALRNGMDFSPGPFIFDTGHAVAVDFQHESEVGVAEILGAGDFVLVPDPLTFQVLPEGAARTGWVLGDEYLRDGRPHPLSTRHVLRRVSRAYAEAGMSPVVGIELEWYLTRRLAGTPGQATNGFGEQAEAPSVEATNAGYQFNLDGRYDSVADLADPLALQLIGLGLPLRSMEHESGPGQLETTLNPLHALDAADALLLLRSVIKRTCASRGYHASFMSLPAIEGFDPSGWHIHQSVVDGSGRNIFSDPDDPDALSGRGLAYVSGLLAHARGLCLMSVPTINGYHRLGKDFPLSPTRIDWSFEDRTALVRALGGGSATHVENRLAEPCANPYLAIGSQLYAGLTGLTGGIVPTPGGEETLPTSLAEALAAVDEAAAADLLGAPLARCLTLLKQSELARFGAWAAREPSPPSGVTAWEHREYFEVF